MSLSKSMRQGEKILQTQEGEELRRTPVCDKLLECRMVRLQREGSYNGRKETRDYIYK